MDFLRVAWHRASRKEGAALTWGVLGALAGFVAYRVVRGTWDPLLVVGVLTTAFLVLLRSGWVVVQSWAGISPDWTSRFSGEQARPEVGIPVGRIHFQIDTKHDRVPHYAYAFSYRLRDPSGATWKGHAGQYGRGAHVYFSWPSGGPGTPVPSNGRYVVIWYRTPWAAPLRWQPILIQRERVRVPDQGASS